MTPRDQEWTPDDAIAVPSERRVGRDHARGNLSSRVALPGPAGGGGLPRQGRARELSLADSGPMLRHLARIVLRHWWIGLLLAAGELTAFYFYMSGRQPMVTAQATMLAQSSLDKVLRRGDSGSEDPERHENALRNHLDLMTSRRFYTALAASFSPAEAQAIEAPFLEPGDKPSPEKLRAVLTRNVSVDRERGRELFTIQARHPDGDIAVMLADRFAEEYLAQSRGDLRGANEEARTALQAEAQEMDRSVQALEAQRKDFQHRFDEITGGGGREVIDDRIKSLNTALSLVRVQRTQAEVQYRQAQADLKSSPTPFNNPTLAAYGNTAELRADIDKRQADRAMLATNYGPNHPKLQEADHAIAMLKEAVQRNFADALEDLQGRVTLAASEESELSREMTTLLQQATEVDRVAAELATLDQKIRAQRDAHSDLLHQIAQVGISAELPSDIMRIVDHADIHHPLISPRLALMAAGFGGALLLFIGGPLCWHACNGRVTSTLNLEMMLGAELLGVVPRLAWMRAAQRPHVVRRGRRAAAVEAFLVTASQFELRSPGGCPRRIVLSSTLPGEGKSVVASNLAAAFTRLGHRALLVDCDFRRPSQHRFHRCANDVGLLRWIEQGCPGGAEASFEAIGLQALPGGTWLLPTGGVDPEPARHFLQPAVAGLFERLGREFDVTIIDTSPAGLFPDAFFVARFSDATALVVREGTASMDQVRKVLADFSRTSAPVAGIIFNAIAGGVSHPSFGYRTIASKYAGHYGNGVRHATTRPRARAPLPVESIVG